MNILKDEIVNDPLGRGYSAMTDQQVLDDLNIENRPRDRSTLTATETANQIDVVEFNALTTEGKAEIWNVLHLGNINPFGVEATIFQNIFGASVTLTNLQTIRVESISRAVELGLHSKDYLRIEIAKVRL